MKALLLFLLLIFSFSLSFSQTYEQIQKEANPQENYVDQSDYAKLWQSILDARKSGDMELYNSLTKKLNNEYPDKFVSTENQFFNPLTVTNIAQTQVPFNPESSDWGTGDVRITNSTISTGGIGNPRVNSRTIRLEYDTLGNLYCGYINGTKDTLMIYKSTNGGTNWAYFNSLVASPSYKMHSFDMFVTDSLNTFRLGLAISLTRGNTSYSGSLSYWSFNAAGTLVYFNAIKTPIDGKGFVGPAIMSDGYKWSAGTTYWYVTYQMVDTTSGITSLALLSMSTDWGRTWVTDTARSGYNDYELDVDYSGNADTIWVLLTNNLTTTNENLRLRFVNLAGIGTATTWKQYNPATTSDNEFLGCLASSRQDSSMAITYTRTVSGQNDIYVTYKTSTSYFVSDNPLTSGTNNKSFARIKSQEKQSAYRMCYVSSGATYDTVKYTSSFAPNSFATFTTVNANNNSNILVAPDVAGFPNGAAFTGAVLFATAVKGLSFDASNLSPTTGIGNNGSDISFELKQNYPNPFNPVTKISFSLPKNSFVTLKVYDITGRQVAELVNKQMLQGSYSIDFNGSNLSSGVYFYKLSTDGFESVKKMMLIK